jgi:NAD(P)-dependent dehydrogenase (short-subunit alcohol dehydrogenase family)
MSNHQQPFFDRTLVVSGSSRGIGQAIALGAAKRGANVVLLAKRLSRTRSCRAPCTPRSPLSTPPGEGRSGGG